MGPRAPCGSLQRGAAVTRGVCRAWGAAIRGLGDTSLASVTAGVPAREHAATLYGQCGATQACPASRPGRVAFLLDCAGGGQVCVGATSTVRTIAFEVGRGVQIVAKKIAHEHRNPSQGSVLSSKPSQGVVLVLKRLETSVQFALKLR